MEQQTSVSELRYVGADDVDRSDLDFNHLDALGNDGSRLGDVGGFLVDPSSGRLVYTVVDTRGWFTSRRFLVPADPARVDIAARALHLDVSRSTLHHYPRYHDDTCPALTAGATGT